jgi:aminoglycoside 6'-N-acetyltransferase
MTAASALSLVPLRRTDFPLMAEWLAQPHVAEWWGDPKGLADIEAEYGPCIDGTDPTLLFLCLEDDRPIGMVQIYRMADNPEYVAALGFADAGALDLLIGEPSATGRGLGTQIIAAATDLIWTTYPEVQGALAGPSVRNARSQRTFEKAGFSVQGQVHVPGEPEDELILYRTRPTGA